MNIEIFEPFVFLRSLSSGRNLPFLCQAINQKTQEIKEIVVKPFHEEFLDSSACKELLASMIAQHLGINVATPVLVDLTNNFISQYKEVNHLEKITCFGSIWAGNYFVDFIKNTQIQNRNLEFLASEIFLLDIFIENLDRRSHKPNLKIKDDVFVIFDHELAFSFLEILPFLKQNKNWIKVHIFYAHFSKIPQIDWNNYVEKFIQKITTIDEDFWNFAENNIPKEWQNVVDMNRIKTHLNKKIQDISVFEQELKNIFLTLNQ